MSTKQTEALRLADVLDLLAMDMQTPRKAATELRRQHAEIETLRAGYDAARLEIESLKQRVQELGQMARDVNSRRVTELEAQLEAVGAGGVSALMGASQAQPVGAAPHWVPVCERLPEPGKPVLLDIGGRTPIRAMWAAKHTVEAGDDDTDWAEYVEADDMYYSPEGWYEWNQHEETHWAVSDTPVAWMDLPAPYSADAATAPQPAAQPVGAEFALAALVAAGHVTQAKVDQAIALEPQPAAQALDAPTDTERLDFLAGKAALVKYDSGWKASLDVSVNAMAQHGYIKDLRAAIDAAIAAQQGMSNG